MQIQDVKSFSYTKEFGTRQQVTPEMMDLINRWAPKALTPDEVGVFKYILAHNGVDRDEERFQEPLLDDFARTLPGKGFLEGHQRPAPGVGIWFDAKVEDISAEEFFALTGEELNLPEGVTQGKALWAWPYVLLATAEGIAKEIEGGIRRHASIGFRAADIVPVRTELDGPVAYWEWEGPGEATEGSMVWLGAQQGATAQKGADKQKIKGAESPETIIGGHQMKMFKYLSDKLKQVITTDEDAMAAIDLVLEDGKTKSAKITELDTQLKEAGEKIKTAEAKMATMEGDAALGKEYLDDLATQFAQCKRLLGECGDTQEKVDAIKAVAMGMPLDYLRAELKGLLARAEKANPTEAAKLKGGEPSESRVTEADKLKNKAAGDGIPAAAHSDE